MRGPAIGSHGFGGGGLRGGSGFHGRPYPGYFPGRSYYRSRYYPRYYGYGYGYGYPLFWGWYDDNYYYPTYDQAYDDAPQDYTQNNQADQQQAEIDRLNDEVARLREQRRNQVNPSPTPTRVWTDAEKTQLVFRDKHTEEIRNYAIVGQTLWIFTEDRAKKIMLAELDLPATKKANDDRGVDFQIPR